MNSLKECREISLSVSLTLLTQNLQVELLGVLQTRSWMVWGTLDLTDIVTRDTYFFTG